MDEYSKNILINVKSIFLPEYTDSSKPEYFFAYYITILNKCSQSIQLLERHWEITDANGNTKIIDGIGVVGEQPTIMKDSKYKYNSFCPLPTEFGKMLGFYKMKSENGVIFKANIPAFNLIVPSHLN